MIHRDETVYSRPDPDEVGETGNTTGGTRTCTIEGCRGVRVGVRWGDGKLTWPCTEGMHKVDGAWYID